MNDQGLVCDTTSSLLSLPFEIRQQIYSHALKTTISITDSRLSRSPTLEEVNFLASRRGSWNLCLTCRRVYSETRSLLWDNLTISLAKDGTSQEGDDGRHRLGNADQALRRKIRHILVTDPACFAGCYGIMHCFQLRSLTIAPAQVDAVFLKKELMGKKPKDAVHKPCKRTLSLYIDQVNPPFSNASGMMINAGNNNAIQIQWRQKWAVMEERFPFMFLSGLIPNLPQGCKIMLHLKVLEVSMKVLRQFKGFTILPNGPDRWLMRYDSYV